MRHNTIGLDGRYNDLPDRINEALRSRHQASFSWHDVRTLPHGYCNFTTSPEYMDMS